MADGGTLLGQTITGLVVLALLGLGFAVVATYVVAVGLRRASSTPGSGCSTSPARRSTRGSGRRSTSCSQGWWATRSFPSGHTGTATGIAGVAAALLWAYTRVAKALLVLLVVVPAFTMVSRLYVGAHHVSDVLTAFVYAAVWLVLCARLLLPARSDRGVEALRARTAQQ